MFSLPFSILVGGSYKSSSTLSYMHTPGSLRVIYFFFAQFLLGSTARFNFEAIVGSVFRVSLIDIIISQGFIIVLWPSLETGFGGSWFRV